MKQEINWEAQYGEFIKERLDRREEGRYHKHHIIPKHMGGEDVTGNMVLLTKKEHCEAHLLLYKAFGHECDFGAIPGAFSGEEKQFNTKAVNDFHSARARSLKKLPLLRRQGNIIRKLLK